MSVLVKCQCCQRGMPYGRFVQQEGLCADCNYDKRSSEEFGIDYGECRWKGRDSGRQCAEYTPVFQPTPLRKNAGVCAWYLFHGRPCHAFIPKFYCQNGYHNEFKDKPVRKRKPSLRRVTIRRIQNGKKVSEVTRTIPTKSSS